MWHRRGGGLLAGVLGARHDSAVPVVYAAAVNHGPAVDGPAPGRSSGVRPDEHALAGQAAVDADHVVAPADVSGLVDRVNAGSHPACDRW